MVVDLLSWQQLMLLTGSDIICKPLILYNTYMCNLEIHYQEKCCWWSNKRNFFKEMLGLSFLTENHGRKDRPNSKIDTAVKNMKSIFEFQWRNELNLSRTTSQNKTGGK